MINPVFIEVTRGVLIESVHRGALAIVDANGSTLWTLGDT
jgi:L-asparaginase II